MTDPRIAPLAAALLQLVRALRKHEPQIDFGYEEVTCKCGWDQAKRPRDSYMAHVQTAILAALPSGWCGHAALSTTTTGGFDPALSCGHDAEIARLRKIEEAARVAAPCDCFQHRDEHHALRVALLKPLAGGSE